jgi:hypothetical protein
MIQMTYSLFDPLSAEIIFESWTHSASRED